MLDYFGLLDVNVLTLRRRKIADSTDFEDALQN